MQNDTNHQDAEFRPTPSPVSDNDNRPVTAAHGNPRPQQPRHYKIIITILIILAIIGVGFGIFGIIYANSTSQETPLSDNANHSSSNTDDNSSDDTTADNNNISFNHIATEAEVRQFIDELKNTLESTLQIPFGEGSETPPLAKFDGAKVYLPLTKYFALTYHYSDYSEDENIKTTIFNALQDYGFIENQEIPNRGFLNIEYYMTNLDMGIVCDVDTFVVTCGSIGWSPSQEDISLANALADAYYTKENRTLPVIYRGANTSNIRDSSVSPYQTISVYLDNAAGLFYRTSPTANWQFFNGAQGEIDCSAYDTDDLKRAFAGEPCSLGSTSSVVTP